MLVQGLEITCVLFISDSVLQFSIACYSLDATEWFLISCVHSVHGRLAGLFLV